jgi:Grap2 and cyclin-D-interacting
MAVTQLTATLATTSGLLDQFLRSLNSILPDGPSTPPDTPPLSLFSASAATLRAQITKLSLLIVTPPFTPSAVSTILASLNEAVLPNLLTSVLLLSPTTFTKAYSTEATALTKAALRDLQCLVQLIDDRFKDSKAKAEPKSSQKSAVTEATGKIWEDCDGLKALADNGVEGFALKKATQYLDLIKDAVKEIEEWDPDEVDGDDDFGVDEEDEDEDEDNTTPPSSTKAKNTTKAEQDPNKAEQETEEQVDKPAVTSKIHQIHQTTLKILTPIPPTFQTFITRTFHPNARVPTTSTPILSPTSPAVSTIPTSNLDTLLTTLQKTSDCIDEVAERLYSMAADSDDGGGGGGGGGGDDNVGAPAPAISTAQRAWGYVDELLK